MKNQVIVALLAAIVFVPPVHGQLAAFSAVGKSATFTLTLFANQNGSVNSIAQTQAVPRGTRVKMRVTNSGSPADWVHTHAVFNFGGGAVTADGGSGQLIVESPWADLTNPTITVHLDLQSYGALTESHDTTFVVSFTADAQKVTLTSDPAPVVLPSGPKLTFSGGIQTSGASNGKSFAMPNLAGQTLTAAQAALTALGYRGQVQTSTKAPPSAASGGKIYGQSPAAGSTVSLVGGTVTLQAYTGTASATMINLVGLDQVVVQQSLASQGIKATLQQANKNGLDRKQENQVIAQSPAPGQPVPAGSLVKITVYDYCFVMPNIEGMTHSAAGSAITNAGYHVNYPAVNVSYKKPSSQSQVGHVTQQVPRAGSWVPREGPLGWTEYRN